MAEVTLKSSKNGNGQIVNADGRALVDAETNLTGHFIPVRDGLAFNWSNVITTGGVAGNNVFYLKNDSTTRNLFIDLMRVSGVNAIRWLVHSATGTAAGGDAVTGTNLNRASGIATTNLSTARGSGGTGALSGITRGDQIAVTRNAAGAAGEIPFNGILILGTDDAIVVEYDAGTSGEAEVLVRGYYKDQE